MTFNMTLINLSPIIVILYALKVTFSMTFINFNLLVNTKYMPLKSLYDDS
jgi:hypothetical protein